MDLTTPSSTPSSSRRSDSEALARRVRHQASRTRQASRKATKKAGARVWVDGYPAARLQRARSIRSNVAPLPPPSPMKRALQYICDMFLPSFLSPTKNRKKIAAVKKRSRATSVLLSESTDIPAEQTTTPLAAGDSVVSLKRGSSNGYDADSEHSTADENQDSASDSDSDPEEDEAEMYAWLARIDLWRRAVDTKNPQELYRAPSDEGGDVLSGPLVLHPLAGEKKRHTVNRLQRDLTNIYGRRPSRFHPYARAVASKFANRNCCSFEQRINSSDPFIARFAKYELDWESITNRPDETLTVESIPWPMYCTAKTYAYHTTAAVIDFINFSKLAPDFEFLYKSPAQLRRVARLELRHRWSPEKFTELVLDRIIDDQEAEVARDAARVVQVALEHLMTVSD